MAAKRGGSAIIIGSGIAGLSVASAISSQFDSIKIIERDTLPADAVHRSGVPQSHHVHALLLRGLLELERLFPGIEAELAEQGARRMDLGADFAHFSEWGWAPRARVDVAPLTVSRRLLECTIRARVKNTITNATFIEDTRVRGFIAERSDGRVRVVGVRTDRPELAEIRGDIVIDASGRNAKSPEWLEAIGVPRAEEQVVDAFSGYASRFYEAPEDSRRWWRGMLVEPAPPSFKRWALLMPIEGNKWVLTLAGVNKEYPPTDEAGFHEYLASLRTPVLAREIAKATPISEIRGHRSLFNRARRYDRWEATVDGLLITGDAAVAFNASHGQGMSMAAWCATTLGETIARVGTDPQKLPKAFHKAQWTVLQRAWEIATGMDLHWPETVGERPLQFRLFEGFAVEATRAAFEDPNLKRSMGPVFQLIRSPYTCFRPSLIARVLYLSAKRRFTPALPIDTAMPVLSADTTGSSAALDAG
jgi:flavin-dependent dehydrogenase